MSGRATDVERALAAADAQRDRFFAQLARATGRPVAHVAAEWEAGPFLEPVDAVALGYADEFDVPGTRARHGGGGEPTA